MATTTFKKSNQAHAPNIDLTYDSSSIPGGCPAGTIVKGYDNYNIPNQLVLCKVGTGGWSAGHCLVLTAPSGVLTATKVGANALLSSTAPQAGIGFGVNDATATNYAWVQISGYVVDAVMASSESHVAGEAVITSGTAGALDDWDGSSTTKIVPRCIAAESATSATIDLLLNI